MTKILYVGIAEYRLLQGEGILACSALGSCVGVCLWDKQTKLAGLLHVLLPTAKGMTLKGNPAKFADTGTEQIVEAMTRRGSDIRNLRAKITGGASLYQYEHVSSATEIGERNVVMTRETLGRLGIPVLAEHVGGEFGRSVKFNAQTFEVRIDVLTRGVSVI